MATDENNHKNEARDDWTGCTFRVERGPSSEGRAWGMARRVFFSASTFCLLEYFMRSPMDSGAASRL